MKLSEIVENITIGDWGNENYSEETPIAVHCIRSADIIPYYNNIYDGVPYRYVSSRSFCTRELKEGDIIIEKSGGTNECSTGRVMYVSDELLEHNDHKLICSNFCASFRVKSGWSPKFVYYFIRLVHQCGIFHNYEGKTSGIHNLQMENAFKAIDLPSLSYDEQIKAADVLSIIERKISLNRSINKELEEMAKEIYCHWFVQFDFPDINGRPYKSSGGNMCYNSILKREIPEGWDVRRMNDVAETYNGATPSTSNPSNYGGNIIWLTPKDLSDQKQKFVYRGERSITQKGYESCSTHMLPKGSILMSSRAPIGLLSIADCDVCTNQGFKSFVPFDSMDNYYIYYYLLYNMSRVKQLGSGTTFSEVSREDIMKFPILYVANRSIYKAWYLKMKPIFKKQAILVREIDELQNQRDELLPLLMTGQVKIK